MVSPETTTSSSSNPTTTTITSTAAANSMLHRFLLSSTNPVNNNTHPTDFIDNNNPFGFGPLFRPVNNITTFTYPQDHHHQDQNHQPLPPAAATFPITFHHHLDDQSAAEMAHHNNTRHLTDLLGEAADTTSSTTTTIHSNNRLSLSLNSHQAAGFIQSYLDCSGEETTTTTCCASSSTTGFMGLSNGYSSFTPRTSTTDQVVVHTDQGSSLNRFYSSSFSAIYSRYLRPCQLLLEEMISLGGKDVELHQVKSIFFGGGGGVSSTELRAEFSTTFADAAVSVSPEKHHELQIKMSKLIALLEQVEMRYQEYCHRMDGLVSSFEAIAGEEAAKTYTAVALQAMCRHFCNLREGILVQIKSVRRNLTSPEFPRIGAGLSQLSLFDKEVNRTAFSSLQQLGQQHGGQRVWRPIRGLPETSVAILRAWLFEHFLNPYPNESEKLILASQTGLTKNQVSNWFINARVRLWKPMIEEMYKDEFGDQSSSADSDPLFSTTTCCNSTRDDLTTAD